MHKIFITTSQLAETIKSHEIQLIHCAKFIDTTPIHIPNSYLLRYSSDTEDFVSTFKKLAFAEEIPIIIYDDGNLESVSKIWYCLRSIGKLPLILDGGIKKWVKEYGPVVNSVANLPLLTNDSEHEINEDYYKLPEEVADKQDEIQFIETSSDYLKILDSENTIKPINELEEFFSAKGVKLSNEKLLLLKGDFAYLCAIALTVIGLKNLAIEVSPAASRRSSASTRFYSIDDTTKIFEINKASATVEEDLYSDSHCCRCITF
ncbi:unnamed protein product [Blepharisma stoltei]|uniref:Rhodanese domain-containing protein n=1 Tax=Blepharisma stoltei TaxID=1481888 RepID=A0AAU9IR29_9CILI|nr:unnamed protein product [Blepharisma stoltei]